MEKICVFMHLINRIYPSQAIIIKYQVVWNKSKKPTALNNEYPVLSNGGDFVTQPSCRMWSSMSINSSPSRHTDPNYISKSCIICSLDWLRVYENNNGDLTIWCHDDFTVVARIWYFSLAIQPRKLDCCSPSF